MREIEILPIGMLDDILNARRFRQTYDAIQQSKGNADRQRDIYNTPMGQWLFLIEAEAAMTHRRT